MSNLVATIQSFVFAFILAESSSASKADKLPRLSVPRFIGEFVNSHPVFISLFLFFFVSCFCSNKSWNYN